MTGQRDQVLAHLAGEHLGGSVLVGRLTHTRANGAGTYSFEYFDSWWGQRGAFPVDPAGYDSRLHIPGSSQWKLTRAVG